MKLPDVGTAFAARPAADEDDIDSRFEDARTRSDDIDYLGKRLDFLAAEMRAGFEMLAERMTQASKRLENKLDDYADSVAAEARERNRLADRVNALESSRTKRPQRARK